MEKKKSTMAASIQLFLLLAVIVTAAHGTSTDTTTTTKNNNIRLPSNGETDGIKQLHLAARPWGHCCDNIERSLALIEPPLYRCNDMVSNCAAGCHHCQQLVPGKDVYVCNDWYSTNDDDPGPACTGGAGTTAPWGDCCDNLERAPTLPYPPRWRCNDELVAGCAAACRDCEQVAPGNPPWGRFVCNDWYPTSHPGPVCTPRPWGDCCDKAFCTRTIPPVCQCGDEVESCAASCHQCDLVRSSSSQPPRFVCRDHFTGEPGPRCYAS